MIFSTLSDFKERLPQQGRLMGLDVGTKWVGVALSDPTQTVATPDTKVARSPTAACLNTLLAYATTQHTPRWGLLWACLFLWTGA